MAINYRGGRTRRGLGSVKGKVIAITAAALIGAGAATGAVIGTVNNTKDLKTEVKTVSNENVVLNARNEFLNGDLEGKEFETIKALEIFSHSVQDDKTKLALEELQRDLCAKYLSSSMNELYKEGYIKENIISQGDFSSEQTVTYTNITTGEDVSIQREDEDTAAVIITKNDGKGNLTTNEYDSLGGLKKTSGTLMTQEELIKAYHDDLRKTLKNCVVTVDKSGNLMIGWAVQSKNGAEEIHHQLITVGDKGEIQVKTYINGELSETCVTSATDRHTFEQASEKANKTAIQFQSINAKG